MSEHSEPKIVTLSELQEHSKKDNLYILINGKGSFTFFSCARRVVRLIPKKTCSLLSCKVHWRGNLPGVSLWRYALIIHNSSYDDSIPEVTKWSSQRQVRTLVPFNSFISSDWRGSTCILGKDATEAFEDVGHSDEAREILAGMLVGDFEKNSVRFHVSWDNRQNSL